MNFQEELKKYQKIVNQELEKYIKKEICPEEKLNASMEYSLISSAKRLRPILILASYRVVSRRLSKCFWLYGCNGNGT